MKRLPHFIIALAALACRPAPAGVSPAPAAAAPAVSAAPGHTGADGFVTRSLTPLWKKTFPAPDRRGVCPRRWAVDDDGAVFMAGEFVEKLELDAVRLAATGESAYLARLSARGDGEWARALSAAEPSREPLSVLDVAVHGDEVLVLVRGEGGSASRHVYTKTGVLRSRRELVRDEAALPALLDTRSWLVEEPASRGTLRIRYADEHGEVWQREYSASHTVAAAAGGGRVAILGQTGGARTAGPRDRVSVLALDTGDPSFSVPVPSDARVEHLGFDAAGRLWVTGRSAGTYDDFVAGTRFATEAREHPFLLVFDREGDLAGWLWAAPGATVTDAPVFLTDGRVAVGLRTSRDVQVRSSFAGHAVLGAGQWLLGLEAGRATRSAVPPNTSCLAPAGDGSVVACVQHLVTRGNVSWAASCELVNFLLPRAVNEAR